MNISQLQKIAHERAKEKGFWPVDIVAETQGEVLPWRSFNFTRESQLHISEKISLIHSELGEATEALRKGQIARTPTLSKMLDAATGKPEAFKQAFEYCAKDTFQDELADVLIRLLDLAGACGIDLETHVLAKMQYNSTREHLHGKQF